VGNLPTFSTILIGKIYELLKKEEHRPRKENNGANFAPFSGDHATAKTIASFQKMGERTVRYAIGIVVPKDLFSPSLLLTIIMEIPL
jgi:hypothetical protein